MYWNALKFRVFKNPVWLTLTWDVLKLKLKSLLVFKPTWLTLTWDVLKSWNIILNLTWSHGLTLTWDVLKFCQINSATAATAD